MLKTSLLQPGETFEAVGVYGRTARDVLFKESHESIASEIRDYGHPCPTSRATSFLDCHQDHGRFPPLKLPASPQACLRTSNPGLVYFDFAPQRLPCNVDHRSAEFVKHYPGRFVT